MSHPCLRCGACCAWFRVAFHWSEAEPALGGAVPATLAVRVDPHRLAMKGTEGGRSRCVALDGTIGRAAACTIYPQRPSPCRELEPATAARPSAQCDRARLAHGLAPLSERDWAPELAAPA